MPRRKKIDIAKSEEVLRSPVNKSGAGEDPIIRDLVKGKLAPATDTEALDMALALRQIIRGQEMTLEQLRKQDAEIAKLKEQAAARDAAAAKFEDDQKRYMEDVLSRAESLRVQGLELDKMKAEAARQTQSAYQEAMAAAHTDRMSFDIDLEKMPKVTVVSPGKLIITHVNGAPATKLMPEEVRIKHRIWFLPPGEAVEVPKIVADVLATRRKDQSTSQRFEQAMAQDLEVQELNKKIADIKRAEVPFDPSKAQSPI